jgi:hypothetical protein
MDHDATQARHPVPQHRSRNTGPATPVPQHRPVSAPMRRRPDAAARCRGAQAGSTQAGSTQAGSAQSGSTQAGRGSLALSQSAGMPDSPTRPATMPPAIAHTVSTSSDTEAAVRTAAS